MQSDCEAAGHTKHKKLRFEVSTLTMSCCCFNVSFEKCSFDTKMLSGDVY